MSAIPPSNNSGAGTPAGPAQIRTTSALLQMFAHPRYDAHIWREIGEYIGAESYVFKLLAQPEVQRATAGAAQETRAVAACLDNRSFPTLLQRAAQDGNGKILRMLMADDRFNALSVRDLEAAFVAAAQSQRTSCLDALATDPRLTAESFRQAFLYAAQWGYSATLRTLLASPPLPQVHINHVLAALTAGATHGHTDVLEAICSSVWYAEIPSAQIGRAIVDAITHRADVIRPEKEAAALYLIRLNRLDIPAEELRGIYIAATKTGSPAIMNALLEAPLLDDQRLSLLTLALKEANVYRRFDILRVVMASPHYLRIPDAVRGNALNDAVLYDQTGATVSVLLADAAKRPPVEYLNQALEKAASMGREESFFALLPYGEIPREKQGETLSNAVLRNKPRIVKALLEKYADTLSGQDLIRLLNNITLNKRGDEEAVTLILNWPCLKEKVEREADGAYWISTWIRQAQYWRYDSMAAALIRAFAEPPAAAAAAAEQKGE